ncbi:MAG: hypothetical protein M1822_007382 [Bathelium mastoideum]|nr:MAG: hypothetical protein M1822_007382 [Bathelium mastoideum]
MNTIRSVGFGWGVLVVAGGGAYYFAKRSINSDRAERAQADRRRRDQVRNLEYQEAAVPAASNKPSSAPLAKERPQQRRRGAEEGGGGGAEAPGKGDLAAASPSSEASSQDPAPTRHAPETTGQRVGEKSKYEASETWRSPKGDRFS